MGSVSRREWIVLVSLFVLSLPAVTTRIYSSDEIQYFAYLRSLWFDRDLSFENEYRHFYDRGIAKSAGFHETFLERRTDTGRRINFATIGCAILWAPFYAGGDVVARAAGAPADGFSTPYVAAVAYGSAAYGFLALVLAILSAARIGLRPFRAAVAIWLGTPLLFYMYVAPPFSHATSAFGVALFIYTWIRVRETWSVRGAFALGAAGALMAMVREQDLFFAFGPALDFLWSAAEGGRHAARAGRLAGAAAAGCVGFAVAWVPQAVSYVVVNGHLGPHASVGNKMNWVSPHALQVLFSPEHGLFVWTPLALIAIAGLLLLPPEGGSHATSGTAARGDQDPVASAFRRKRHVPICLLVMVALQIYVGGSVESWTVAGAFGQRRFIALTAVLVVGYAALDLAVARKAARATLAAATIVAVYWNLAMIAEFATGLMDRQRLEPAKNAYDAFVTLPRMAPDLAYRYLFDRTSFYKPTP
jgi:hypothetical protein